MPLVMAEVWIDISLHEPKLVNRFIKDEWDFVIAVGDNAKETCTAFLGKVTYRLHVEFEDPTEAKGGEVYVISVFRGIRDEKGRFLEF